MIHYRLATINDLKYVANLHLTCFEGYFLSELGEKLLEKYYLSYMNENNLFVLAFNDNQLIGFCMGYLKGSTARIKFQKKHLLCITFRILYNILRFNKITINKLITIFFNKKGNMNDYVPDSNLLSICLHPEYRGQGIADEMITQFEHLLLNYNCKDYMLTVKSSNIIARKFYEKKGFTLYKEFNNECKYIKSLINRW